MQVHLCDKCGEHPVANADELCDDCELRAEFFAALDEMTRAQRTRALADAHEKYDAREQAAAPVGRCPLCATRDESAPGDLCVECARRVDDMGLHEPDELRSLLMQYTLDWTHFTREDLERAARALHKHVYDPHGGCLACHNVAGRPHDQYCYVPVIERKFALTPPPLLPYL